MDNKLISIITPSYNQGEFIEETIKSVLNQTYQNFEYIIYDSCSNDNTNKILEKYKDNPKIKIFVEKDNGQTDAINKGFKSAKGELVGWINSDDILDENCLYNIVNAYKNNKDKSIFYGDIEIIDIKGNKIKDSISYDNISYKSLLFENPQVVQPGSFYNKDLVAKVGYLDESLNFVMDYDLWIRLVNQRDSFKVNNILAKFRLHNESKTMGEGNSKRFWKEIYWVRKNKYNINRISKFDIFFIKWIFKALINKIN